MVNALILVGLAFVVVIVLMVLLSRGLAAKQRRQYSDGTSSFDGRPHGRGTPGGNTGMDPATMLFMHSAMSNSNGDPTPHERGDGDRGGHGHHGPSADHHHGGHHHGHHYGHHHDGDHHHGDHGTDSGSHGQDAGGWGGSDTGGSSDSGGGFDGGGGDGGGGDGGGGGD